MTHEHDFDLILAIAGEDLGPADLAAAEASLISCSTCRTDLELQREALVALQAFPDPAMTELERVRLHRTVAGALDPPASVATSRRSVPWFQRLVPAMAAAAALLVVVGVASLLVDNDTGSFDAIAETTSSADPAPMDGADEEAGEMGGALEFDDTEGAPTTTMAALAPAELVVEDLGDISTSDLRAAALSLISEPAARADDMGNNVESMARATDLVCTETAGEAGEIIMVQRATVDGLDVEIYLIDNRVDVFARPDCFLFDSFQ